MKTPHVLFLMLAGLAGGVGVRLAFSLPADADDARGRHSGESVRVPNAAAASSSPDAAGVARPSESEILTADGGTRHRLLMTWIAGAGEEELRRMAEALAGGESNDFFALRLLMVRWVEVNPRGLLEWAAAKGGGGRESWCVSEALTAWARVDFESAWAAGSAGHPRARGAALQGLAEMDPDKCLRLLRADPGLMKIKGYTWMEDVLMPLSVHDPAGVAALLKSLPAPDRGSYSGNLALAWAKSDPAAAVAWMKSLEPGLRSHALHSAGPWIASHAPEQLPTILEGLPPSRVRGIIEAAGLQHLAATDPDAARRQIEAMPAGPARQYSRGLLLKELFQRGDEAGALALASQLGWKFAEEWSPSRTEISLRHRPLIQFEEWR